MGEIRWLYESNNKTPEQEVFEEDNKNGKNFSKWLVRYRKANNIQTKDSAVAGMLDVVVGNHAGSDLQKSLGLGFLTRFMSAFKLGSLTEDNLFIKLLKSIWTYDDGTVIKNILQGKKPQSKRDISPEVAAAAKNIKVEESVVLNELSGTALQDYARQKGLIPNEEPNDNTQVEPKEQTDSEPEEDKTMSDEEAKILDMSARDMFLVLYNGYLDHVYTGQDLVGIDNNKDNNGDAGRLWSKDGKTYWEISPQLKDIILKSQDSENAFEYKDNNNKNNNGRNRGREVKDLKDQIIRAIRDLSPEEKSEVRKALQ